MTIEDVKLYKVWYRFTAYNGKEYKTFEYATGPRELERVKKAHSTWETVEEVARDE